MEQALEGSGSLGLAGLGSLATQCRTVQLREPLLPQLLLKTFQTLRQLLPPDSKGAQALPGKAGCPPSGRTE